MPNGGGAFGSGGPSLESIGDGGRSRSDVEALTEAVYSVRRWGFLDQTQTIDKMLVLASAGAASVDRGHRPGHFTASAAVIDVDGRRAALMLHRKLGRWFQPGGHADGDTNLAAVAWREATEELGVVGLEVCVPAVDVDIHVVRPPQEDEHLHFDVRFVVLAPSDAELVGNDESDALAWVRLDDDAGLDDFCADPSLRRLLSRSAVALGIS